MFSFPKLSNAWLPIGVITVSMLGLIAFTEARRIRQTCPRVVVEIADVDGHYYIAREDVMRMLTKDGEQPLLGEHINHINISALERRLRRYGWIKQSNVSQDLSGTVYVRVEQPRPVGRLLSVGDVAAAEAGRVAQGRYISDDGRLVPLSSRYSARVPLLTGEFFARQRALRDSAGRPVLALLNALQQEDMWRQHIAEVNVDAGGNVVLWPQTGEFQVEFGPPIDIERKLRKLRLFYERVMPTRPDTATYSRVNVQFRNQIVCE